MARGLLLLALLLSGCVYQSGPGYEYSSFPWTGKKADYHIHDRIERKWMARSDPGYHANLRERPIRVKGEGRPGFTVFKNRDVRRPMPNQLYEHRAAAPGMFGGY